MKIVDVECKITEAIIEGNAQKVAQQKGLLPPDPKSPPSGK